MIVFSSNLTCDNNNNFGEREGRLNVKKDQTYTETIMRSIRRDIILGTYRPGDKLVISELKKYYQVSLSVIREALTRLTEQEIVTATPNVGFRVAQISPQGIKELKQARLINEGTAIKLAIERGSIEWEAKLVAAYYKLAHTEIYLPKTQQLNLEWFMAHKHFHMTIVEGAGNRFLSKICLRLWNQSELSRSQALVGHKVAPGIEEHRQLTKAITDRDVDRALEIHAAHLTNGINHRQK